MKRQICAVTVARSDYGIYVPVLRAIQEHRGLELTVVAAASHLKQKFGRTVNQIQNDGFHVAGHVDMLLPGDSPHDIARATALGIAGFADVFEGLSVDILLLLGDRFEMHAAGVASVPFLMPIAHLHGGEESTGAIDNVYRHSLTKLSHLHFVSTELHAQRVRQMGEESWRVMVSGAPAIDHILGTPCLSRKMVEQRIGIALPENLIIGTYHPVTTEPGAAASQITEFLEALRELELPVLLTMPNADSGGNDIRRAIESYRAVMPHLIVVENLGHELYTGVMELAMAMVGNSSSGIIEAASFGLPAVNIGNRQQGRARNENTIDVGTSKAEILAGLRVAISPEFRANLKNRNNIYGDGRAAARIVTRLAEVNLGPELIKKPFVDLG